MRAKHDAFDTRPEHWMSSHVNQSLQAVLSEDEATVRKSLFAKVLCRYVGQSLAGEAKVWQIFWCNIVGDLDKEFIRKSQELLRISSVRGQSADWYGGWHIVWR